MLILLSYTLAQNPRERSKGLKLLETIVNASAHSCVRDLVLSQASKKGPGRPKSWDYVAHFKAKARS